MKRVDEILAKSPTLAEVRAIAAPLTRSHEKLLDAATAIRLDPDKADAAFMARELVQCTLPHSNPGNIPAWSRRNGGFALGIVPGVDIEKGKSFGYPYGTIPRLLLFWMTTEAVRTKKRRLELGHSLSSFMRDVGLDPNTGGGKRSDARRLQDQMRRLFNATISFRKSLEEAERHGERWLNMQIAPEGELWWDTKQPMQGVLWGSWIELGEKFFQAITAAPVPVDTRVLRAIKRSPLALDLYAWATWRVFRMQRATFIPWEGLMLQIGAEYTDLKNFKRKAKAALRKIRAVYPGLKLDLEKRGGFALYPSPPSVPAIPKRIAQT
jgi:hypothetical protein